MAEKMTFNEIEKARGEERVEIELFAGEGKYSEPVFVAVNGETCRIQRGVPVHVKRKFVDVLNRSMMQDAHTVRLIRSLSQA